MRGKQKEECEPGSVLPESTAFPQLFHGWTLNIKMGIWMYMWDGRADTVNLTGRQPGI